VINTARAVAPGSSFHAAKPMLSFRIRTTQPVLPKAVTMVDESALGAVLINSNLIALALADMDQLLFVNAAFNDIFGRRSGLAGVSLLDLLLPVHREWVGAALRAGRGPTLACVAEASRGRRWDNLR
jgi:hypothetical protein